MPITAFVVQVPSAEGLVSELRNRFDPTVQLGVPAHISILVPFMDPGHVTSAVLAKAQAALMEIPSFEFALRRVGRFPTTAYLTPEPSEPFVTMTAALVRAFPEFPPYGGEHAEVIPHLTVSHGDAEYASLTVIELEQKLRAAGRINATCTSVVMLENSTGLWKEMHLFKLQD
jgi:hypothetical protein